MTPIDSYRIGWWTHRWWPTMALLRGLLLGVNPSGRKARRRYYAGAIIRRLRLIRRPHRPWQAETNDGTCRFARRAFTRKAAALKVYDDWKHARGLITGHPIDSPYQLRRTARANAKAVRRSR